MIGNTERGSFHETGRFSVEAHACQFMLRQIVMREVTTMGTKPEHRAHSSQIPSLGTQGSDGGPSDSLLRAVEPTPRHRSTAPYRRVSGEYQLAPTGISDVWTTTAPRGVVVAMGTLRFTVIEDSWGVSPLSQLQERAFDGGIKSFPGGSQSVVAENLNGDRHVLAVAQTMDEAQERAATIERDFRALSPTKWCERYDVPVSFVAG